ncbi:hypothetical protein ARMSODRAFT_342345 [Armillaria solidipes]|uniref:Uncharacterized protein n=1 Tax=Armillaria solidipes TaxID=1076256 RepID=A0A2H3B791_9AGAR|nr:hypothetical protein ARMSODRAFT_342345 [Armillaria solidipes]
MSRRAPFLCSRHGKLPLSLYLLLAGLRSISSTIAKRMRLHIQLNNRKQCPRRRLSFLGNECLHKAEEGKTAFLQSPYITVPHPDSDAGVTIAPTSAILALGNYGATSQLAR